MYSSGSYVCLVGNYVVTACPVSSDGEIWFHLVSWLLVIQSEVEKFRHHPSWRCRSQISYLSVAWDYKVAFWESWNKLPYFVWIKVKNWPTLWNGMHKLKATLTFTWILNWTELKTKVQMSGTRLQWSAFVYNVFKACPSPLLLPNALLGPVEA